MALDCCCCNEEVDFYCYYFGKVATLGRNAGDCCWDFSYDTDLRWLKFVWVR
jgi:hypothetical protein